MKSQLIGKDPGVGKDPRQEERGITEDEMIGWHHRLNGYEFEKTPADSRGQESLACCNPWGCRVSDTSSNCTTAHAKVTYKARKADRSFQAGSEMIN